MIKVSVVIPIYNVRDYIEECLKSVVNQTLKDIEIICVNDGTPDDSMKIVQKYAKKDERIIIVNKENGGVSSTRNEGIKRANGELIYFLDSDDYIENNMLEETYRIMKENELDTLYFDSFCFCDSDDVKETFKKYDAYYERKTVYNGIYDGKMLFKEMLKNGEYRASPVLQIIKRKLLLEKNIRFIEGIIHEDEAFSIEVITNSKRTMHINKKYYNRRVRSDSIMTGSKKTESMHGYFKVLLKLMPYLYQKEYEEILDSLYSYINILLNNIIKLSMQLDDNEMKKFKKKLTKQELIAFRLLIEPSSSKNKKILILEKEKQNNKNNSLKKLFKLRIKNKLRKIRIKARITTNKIKLFITKRPKVSIIMPVYNYKDYLKETLDCLINQTLKEIEIICIDDESTDGSYEILKEYANKDKRIKILKQKHSNAGNARNLGIDNSNGEYLLFLDSDDIFLENLCKYSYNHAIKNNVDIVLFGANRYDMKTNKKSRINFILETEIIPNGVFSPKDINDKIFQISSSAPWSKLFKSSFVKSNNMRFQSCSNSNDVFFTRTSFVTAKRIVMLNKVLVEYRINHGINTQAKKHKEPLAFFNAYKEVKRYLEEHNLYETYKNSFRNVVAKEIIFNYNTTKDEAKNIILDKLKNGGLKELDIHNMKEEDFYDYDVYYDYCNLIDFPHTK